MKKKLDIFAALSYFTDMANKTNIKERKQTMDFLKSDCIFKTNPICSDVNCNDAVKKAPHGNYYITMGHAGFNSKLNNRQGYATERAARAAMKRFLRK